MSVSYYFIDLFIYVISFAHLISVLIIWEGRPRWADMQL